METIASVPSDPYVQIGKVALIGASANKHTLARVMDKWKRTRREDAEHDFQLVFVQTTQDKISPNLFVKPQTVEEVAAATDDVVPTLKHNER